MEKQQSKLYVVYLHKNPLNYKKYIGMTSQSPKKRWGANGIGYKDNATFWSEIQKFGWDFFDHIIMFETTSEEEAYAKEKELIAYFKTIDPEWGYNSAEGGLGLYGYNLTEEIKKSLRQATIENGQAKAVRCVETDTIYPSIEMAARDIGTMSKYVSDCCNGRRLTIKGYHWELVDAAQKISSEPNNQPKPVICLDTKEVYPSIKAAAKAHGIDYTGIRKCCHGQRPTAGKCRWRFYEEANN